MFSKKNRISREDFGRFFKKSRSFQSEHITLRVARVSASPQKEGEQTHKNNEPKFSFTASKKVERSAYRRNKVKRRARSVIRKNYPYVQEWGYYFFIFKKGAQNISYYALESEILDLLKKSDSLKKEVPCLT